MSKQREITPAEVIKALQEGGQQTRYVTRVALAELAKIKSIEELLRSQNAYKPGKR